MVRERVAPTLPSLNASQLSSQNSLDSTALYAQAFSACERVCACWGHHVSRPHNTGWGVHCCSLPAGPSLPRGRGPCERLGGRSACISLSSTASVFSTFSPSWTKTAAGACLLLVVSCAKSSWTLVSGIYFTSAPRVSLEGTTLCWDPRCGI